MIPGPANILSCPHCGGKKEVMSLVSGNTCGATVWSDLRHDYPMLPEVSPVQLCPHCSKYFFIGQAKSEYGEDEFSQYSFELGTLDFGQLKEAKAQMEGERLTTAQKAALYHLWIIAYNDLYRRSPGKNGEEPSEEDKRMFDNVLDELIDIIELSPENELFYVELLREAGRFTEAGLLISGHNAEEDRWIAEAMEKKISDKDKLPFLLIKDGNRAI